MCIRDRLSMHIAASNPLALDQNSIDQTLVNKEILKRFNEEKLDFAFPTQTILKKEI